jgi:pSer/pThr/pTyr-binding forkhead associated (FHA) protein
MVDARSDLARRIPAVEGLLPEHIVSLPSDETDAVLVDRWSRLHALAAVTVIGRDAANPIAVYQVSVSRRHVELRYDVDADSWTIEDLGSRNGTMVDGVPLPSGKPRALSRGALLLIGEIGFVFVADRAAIPTAAPLGHTSTAQSLRRIGELRIWPPTQGGAGTAGNGDVSITLGSTQFALLRMLADRFSDADPWVRSIDLIAGLPWNTAHPEDNHVKQQVRRLRRALERLGLPDAIESRHGFGYRLRVKPVMESATAE